MNNFDSLKAVADGILEVACAIETAYRKVHGDKK